MDNHQYKYIHAYLASEDTLNGGWLLHFLAPTTDRFDDYKRCKMADTRVGRVMQLLYDEQPVYEPVYYNWLGLHFPLLHKAKTNLDIPYNELDKDTKSLCALAERHLLIDAIFEKYYYTAKGMFKSDWATMSDNTKDELISSFRLAVMPEDL